MGRDELPSSEFSPEATGQPAERIKSRRKMFVHRRQSWVVRFLKQLEINHLERLTAQPGGLSPGWLLSYRTTFRTIAGRESGPAVRMYLLDCPVVMTPLGVWLLGQCADRCRLYGLEEFGRHSSASVRRHAARALRRQEAWSQLRVLAENDPQDARLQWFAYAPITKRSYNERLRNFTTHLDASHAEAAAGPSRMLLWFRDFNWQGVPPKSAEYIRWILARIHRLIHG
jgi:hypothetical protein